MPYYRIRVGDTREVVTESERTLQQMGESYKDRLIGECDEYGNLKVPYISPEVEAMLSEAAEEFAKDPRYKNWLRDQDSHGTDNPKVIEMVVDCANRGKDVTYGEALRKSKSDLGLGYIDKVPTLTGLEPAYKITPASVDPVKETFETQIPVTPEEVGVVELTPGGSYADDRAMLIASLREMSFSRSKPTAAGGFTLPIHEGIQLSRQIENYRRILISVAGEKVSQLLNDADLLKVMPQVLEAAHTTSQAQVGCCKCDHSANGCSSCNPYFIGGIPPKLRELILGEKATQQPDPVELTLIEEENEMLNKRILTVAEFKATYPLYSMDIYRNYLRERAFEMASKNEPLVITDQDTLVELEIAMGKRIDVTQLASGNDASALMVSTLSAHHRQVEELQEMYQVERKKRLINQIILIIEQWWERISTEAKIPLTLGDSRNHFIFQQFHAHIDYIREALDEMVSLTDTQADIRMDNTENSRMTVLGRNSKGEWFRAISIAYNPSGHFELYEALED